MDKGSIADLVGSSVRTIEELETWLQEWPEGTPVLVIGAVLDALGVEKKRLADLYWLQEHCGDEN